MYSPPLDEDSVKLLPFRARCDNAELMKADVILYSFIVRKKINTTVQPSMVVGRVYRVSLGTSLEEINTP